MSDADRIEKAARQIIDDAATVSPHNAKYHVASAISIIRQAIAPLLAENERLRAEKEASDSDVADLIREHNEDSHEKFKQQQQLTARIAVLEAELVGLKELLKRMRCHIYAEAHYGNSVNAESWLGYLSDIDAAIKTQEPPNAK